VIVENDKKKGILSFNIKNFKLPISLTTDIVNDLLGTNNNVNDAPEHMYI
jgi:hypothetical protein